MMPTSTPLSKLTIRTDDDPCLRRKSAPVKSVGPGERMLMEAMLSAMYAAKGIGLAAPQVGINQKIFVMDSGEGPFFIVDPQILRRSGFECMEEGCLSLPGKVVNVRRAKTIRVRYLDQDNRAVERTFSGLAARVFLHENDHLLGKLIVDYRGIGERLGLKKSVRKCSQKEPVI